MQIGMTTLLPFRLILWQLTSNHQTHGHFQHKHTVKRGRNKQQKIITLLNLAAMSNVIFREGNEKAGLLRMLTDRYHRMLWVSISPVPRHSPTLSLPPHSHTKEKKVRKNCAHIQFLLIWISRGVKNHHHFQTRANHRGCTPKMEGWVEESSFMSFNLGLSKRCILPFSI